MKPDGDIVSCHHCVIVAIVSENYVIKGSVCDLLGLRVAAILFVSVEVKWRQRHFYNDNCPARAQNDRMYL